MSNKFLLFLFSIVTVLSGCQDRSDLANERGPISSQDLELTASCQGHCGKKSAASCWCDSQCKKFGDCCEDKVATCDTPALPPPPKSCGGWQGNTCGPNQFCSYTKTAHCGFADASGVCKPKPTNCPVTNPLVCGCNGQTYSNACTANAAGISVKEAGACVTSPPPGTFCGGFANIQCPEGMECVDNPDDSCDPANGGADCGGICQTPACQPLVCEILCTNGFKKNAAGCQICECNPPTPAPVTNCEGACGKKSKTANCWCDDACSNYGDCCTDLKTTCNTDREVATGMCIKNSGDTCTEDSDCQVGGCGGELCHNENVSSGITTCQCTAPTTITGCGCVQGSCNWYNE